MKIFKSFLSFAMAIAFFGLMSFTFSNDQPTNTADQLNTATSTTAAVEGKWGKGRKKTNDDGSVTTTYKCIKSGDHCVVGTISKVTIWPVGN